jgi:hypothetical protein
VTPQHIDHRPRLGEKAHGSRRTEAPRSAETIVSPPSDAVAVPEADDSGLGRLLTSPHDEARLEPEAPVVAVKPESNGLGATAAID